MYCRKEMAKILKCYLIPKKSDGTLSKGAIFFGQPCTSYSCRTLLQVVQICSLWQSVEGIINFYLLFCMLNLIVERMLFAKERVYSFSGELCLF